MAIPKKITKTLNLDLTGVPKGLRKEVKEEVGEFVVGQILREVQGGNSPVSGESKFKKLSKEYADEQKGGNRNPNLDLEGDMLNSLISKNTKDGIEVGIFASSEVPKADGHNNFSGESRLPRRRFIPDEDQSFKRDINSGIKRIVDSYKVDERPQERTITRTFPTAATTIVNIDNVIDDFLGDLFGESENGL